MAKTSPYGTASLSRFRTVGFGDPYWQQRRPAQRMEDVVPVGIRGGRNFLR
jgi:hypothetical protein